MSRTQPVQCRVCGAERAYPEPYYWLWRDRSFALHRCTQCSHQFVYPSVNADDQTAIYSDHYFSKVGDWVCGVVWGSYIDAEAKLRGEARGIRAMLPSPPGRLLDIGCAGGVFLDEARSWGFEVAGIEFNPAMARRGTTAYGLEIVVGRIEDVPRNRWAGAFDVITILDCLEHVPDPAGTLGKLNHWLRPDGTVFIRGPLSNSRVTRFRESLRRALRLKKQLPGYPLDANLFNKRSMETLLTSTRFDRIRWIGETTTFSNVSARKVRDA